MEAGARNLLLNQRISLESLWLAPSVVKSCSGAIDENVFRKHSVSIALDLSLRVDLTAAAMAAQDDDGVVHLKLFVFTPMNGLADRAARDRAPFEQWVRDGFLVAVPGATVDYEWVCEYLKGACDDMGVELATVEFDRWRIKEFKDAAARVGFAGYAEWHEVGQGYKDFSPRIEKFEELMLQQKIRTGSHPLFNMAAANAIAVRDPSGNRKLDKSKSTLRIDPLVASTMAVFAAATVEEVGAFIV
jgi:phage terminase large subunit-like protein